MIISLAALIFHVVLLKKPWPREGEPLVEAHRFKGCGMCAPKNTEPLYVNRSKATGNQTVYPSMVSGHSVGRIVR